MINIVTQSYICTYDKHYKNLFIICLVLFNRSNNKSYKSIVAFRLRVVKNFSIITKKE